MKVTVCTILVVVIFCLAFPVRPSSAQDSARDEEKRRCLKCHGGKSSVKQFPDGDILSTYVDPKALDKSVHRSLRCTACHKEFFDRRHPDRTFRNKLQYRIKESHGCRDCHAEGAIKSRAIHRRLFEKEGAGEAVVCTDCHSAHAVTPITAGAISTSEGKYCLSCHAHEKRMAFNSGESLSIRVQVDELRHSSHRNLRCSDCHFGFSAEDHPRRRFRSEREYRLSSSEICRRCHFDKYSKVSESIHYTMLGTGRLEAPACVDCHGGHAVSSLGTDRLSVVKKCRTCHAEVYEVYAQSVHGSALFNEDNKDVPICIDCHSSHSIKDPSSPEFRNYIPDMCSNCHSKGALMGKYGLSTEVVKTYLSDFHGVTLGFYRKSTQERPGRPMAVCTDCHGTHDIAGVRGADTQAVKKKLLKQCQTCHSKATENFPEAWLSHYKPSLKVAPAVFIVDKLYGILMPLMVVGLLFQVLLHIWRYLSSR